MFLPRAPLVRGQPGAAVSSPGSEAHLDLPLDASWLTRHPSRLTNGGLSARNPRPQVKPIMARQCGGRYPVSLGNLAAASAGNQRGRDLPRLGVLADRTGAASEWTWLHHPCH